MRAKRSRMRVKRSRTRVKRSHMRVKRSRTRAKRSRTRVKRSRTRAKRSHTRAKRSHTRAKRSQMRAKRSHTRANWGFLGYMAAHVESRRWGALGSLPQSRKGREGAQRRKWSEGEVGSRKAAKAQRKRKIFSRNTHFQKTLRLCFARGLLNFGRLGGFWLWGI